MNLSYNILSLFPLHLFTTVWLFILCFLVVIAVKVVILHLKNKLNIKSKKLATPPIRNKSNGHKSKRYKKPAKPPVTYKSIEINPEEIDRIYVKRSS